MKPINIVGACLLLGLALAPQASELKPFSTDGCSMWIDGTPEQPNLWRHCCVAHDLAYWLGGSETQRQAADAAIESCVVEAQGSGMARYMYANVRWGGSPYWMTSYRWGYGWDYWEGMKPRGYREPSAAEQAQIEALLPAAKATQQKDLETHPVLPVPASNSASSSS
jgi:hypothetical protein